MRAGSLDHQITINKKLDPPNRNSFNEAVVEWVPLVAVPGSPVIGERWWAEVQDTLPSRSESVRNGLDVARDQTRIRMRYRNDIDSSMQVIVHGDTDLAYRIISGPVVVTSAGRKKMIEMMVERFSTVGRES